MKTIISLVLIWIAHNALSQTISFKTEATITEAEIRNTLSVYPPNMLRMIKWIDVTHLEENVCGLAHWDGIELSSVHSREVIIETINHEASSIFLKQPRFGEVYDSIMQLFYQINGDMQYRKMKASEITELNAIQSNYFIGDTYAMTSFENDYNTICEYLFTNGKEVIANITSKPNSAINKKVRCVINYYHSFNSKFTSDFFSKL